MLGLIVVFAHLGFSYIRIFRCGFVFVIVAAARTQRLPLKVCTHPLKCESFCATGGLAIQISIKCDQYSYLSDTHADHKVLYHLRGSGTSILYPLSFTLNSLRSFEIKSKAGAERVQLLPESDKIFITLWPHIIGMRPSSPPPSLWPRTPDFGSDLETISGRFARTQCAADDVECSCIRRCCCC